MTSPTMLEKLLSPPVWWVSPPFLQAKGSGGLYPQPVREQAFYATTHTSFLVRAGKTLAIGGAGGFPLSGGTLGALVAVQGCAADRMGPYLPFLQEALL